MLAWTESSWRVSLVVLCAWLHMLCMVWILKLQGTQRLGWNNLNFIKRSLTKGKLREHSVQPHLKQRKKLRLFHSFVHSFNIYVKNTEVEVNLILTQLTTEDSKNHLPENIARCLFKIHTLKLLNTNLRVTELEFLGFRWLQLHS